MSAQSDRLKAALTLLWSDDYTQKNPSKSYKASFPSEYNALAAFLNGGADPGDVFTSKHGLRVQVGV